MISLSAMQIQLLVVAVLFASLAPANEIFDNTRLQKKVIVHACHDPMQIEVLSGDRVLFIERHGAIKITQPATGKIQTVGRIPVAVFGEVGLMGLACDAGFENNNWIYVLFCPEQRPDVIRLSRFSLPVAGLITDSEIIMLEYQIDKDEAVHMGGGLYLDRRGNLHIGTGDNCPPIPELPVDQRLGRESFDAFRSSANSKDLRGKVLRIHPEPDGTYTIPEDNLFSDPTQGRPEIYAMGCRNPFRLSVDESSGTVYWGDVGPNVDNSLQLGPNGYDEINRASVAGNFGWPMFIGANEAYRNFDFSRRAAGPTFNIDQPVNPSRNNTGIRLLPEAKGALIWYPSGKSRRFPALGSGGRSAMAGPVYHFDHYPNSLWRLPKRFDGSLFIYDWTRNWICEARLNNSGAVTEIKRFMPNELFRKPIDMEIGPDGSLFIVEYGETWGGNRDAQISKIFYQRGNRTPIVTALAEPEAGRHPLHVVVDASTSHDPDPDDELSFRWDVDGRNRPEIKGHRAMLTFDAPGAYLVTVHATDSLGATDSATTEIRVGNSAPIIEIQSPPNGSFFDWEEIIRYRISAQDTEDGTTTDGSIPSGRVLLNRKFLPRRPPDGVREVVDPGLTLMRKTTCFSCHTTKSKSAGPAYLEIAKKYRNDTEARERLAQKIIQGSVGMWGSRPMPPHPQHSLDETTMMVDWILSLGEEAIHAPIPGRHGFFRAEELSQKDGESGVIRLTAEYTDHGAENAPAIRSEESCILHTRRKRASSFDRRKGTELVDVYEREEGLVVKFAPGDWITFRDVNLSEIDRITWRAGAWEGATAAFSLRVDSPDGPEVANLILRGMSDELGIVFRETTTTINDPGGLHDLYVVNSTKQDATVATLQTSHSSAESAAQTPSLAWIEFHQSSEANMRKRKENLKRKKILLIPTKLDHAWATHMYTDVCRILAACLNEHPDVQAVVSPDLDWPKDNRLLSDVDAIVYYSRPAGDIILSPRHRKETLALMRRGVGFTAIHWATGAEKDVGEEYRELLGGWFNFDHSELKVDRKQLLQAQPEHPICRGWTSYLLRDEFYLNLRFSHKTEAILKVNVDGKDQTVAWALNRNDGGRSFGTTLGHFHENYTHGPFRRMIVNGILWTAKLAVPESGAVVEIDRDVLTLPEKHRQVVRNWDLEDLRSLLDKPLRGRHFGNGEKLFQTLACASCHTIDGTGGRMGPDLATIRTRLAKEADPRLSLLREIVEPSHRIGMKHRTKTLLLDNGHVVRGILKAQTPSHLTIASNASKPSELTQIPVEQIEQETESKVSMMPRGLLNTLQEDEILDLLAYVESGSQPEYIAFQPIQKKIETWSNPDLPVKTGLNWWLDADSINTERERNGISPLKDGMPLARWPDGSGFGRHARQRLPNSQPIFRDNQNVACVVFDGVDDLLTAGGINLKTRDFSAFLVVRISNNRGWPGLMAANAIDQNDYQTGFNIDLMPEPTEAFSSLMAEGPGFIGVNNLMQHTFPFERFQLITLTSQPGRHSVRLRVNGQPQGTRDRSESRMRIDELNLGARIWSNQPEVAPFYRGFLNGAVANVLLYNRVLSETEQRKVEGWLSEKMVVLEHEQLK